MGDVGRRAVHRVLPFGDKWGTSATEVQVWHQLGGRSRPWRTPKLLRQTSLRIRLASAASAGCGAKRESRTYGCGVAETRRSPQKTTSREMPSIVCCDQ